jgi:two-component sensor histidine kinase
LIVVSLTVSPVKNAEGKIVGASKIARDITGRKRSQEQITILAREAEHRSKNLLASVQAMVKLSQSDTSEGLKDAVEGRTRALANVHSLFYSKEAETRVRVDGPQVFLKPDIAQPIASILHELATNAAKYGALSAAEGRIDLKWSHGADGWLILCWTEMGAKALVRGSLNEWSVN